MFLTKSGAQHRRKILYVLSLRVTRGGISLVQLLIGQPTITPYLVRTNKEMMSATSFLLFLDETHTPPLTFAASDIDLLVYGMRYPAWSHVKTPSTRDRRITHSTSCKRRVFDELLASHSSSFLFLLTFIPEGKLPIWSEI